MLYDKTLGTFVPELYLDELNTIERYNELLERYDWEDVKGCYTTKKYDLPTHYLTITMLNGDLVDYKVDYKTE